MAIGICRATRSTRQEETVDELIPTVRELVEIAKRARERLAALTGYTASVVA